MAEPGGQGGQGGDGGDAGDSGNGGNGGNLLLKLVEPEPNLTAPRTDGGNPSASGSPGKPGKPGAGGIGGRKMDEQNVDSFGLAECSLGDNRAPSGPLGPAGQVGSGGTAGNPGSRGNATVQTVSLKDFQTLVPSTLAARTLRKAERSYLNGDFEQTATLLGWLHQVSPDTPDWKPLRVRVLTLLSQLRQGLTYYSRPRNAVPLADASTYLTTLGPLLTAGEIIEGDYLRFRDQQQTTADRMQALKSQLDGVGSAVQQLQAQMQKAADQQGPVNDAVQQLHDKIQAQYAVLIVAQTRFQDALRTMVGCATFKEILTAVGTVVTTGGAGFQDLMKASDALKNNDASNEDDDSGFDTIIKAIETATSDISSIKGAWTTLADIIKNAPDAGKIAIKEEDFDQLMQPYLSMPEAQAYVQAMHDYLNLIQARNQKLMEYDALVILQAQIQATIAQKQAEAERVSQLIADEANQDPTLADYVAYMEGTYQDMQSLLLRELFEANAALSYFTLVETDLSIGDDRDITMADIATAFDRIQVALPDFINNSRGPQQPFAQLPVVLGPAPSGTYTNPETDPFRAFIRGDGGTHQLTFSVPLGTLPGLYQVTATDFSILLTGAKTTDNHLMIRLQHSGCAQFQDSAGGTITFSHNPIDVYYAYAIDTNGNITVIGGGSLSSSAYIGLSPSTCWTLTMRADENPGLDLSRLTQIAVNYAGKSRLRPMQH